MRTGRLLDADTGAILVPRLVEAETVWEKTVGLLGRPELEADAGLWLPGCRAVHTCFMRFAIALAWLDGAGTILRTDEQVAPFRFRRHQKAAGVIELPADAPQRLGLVPGQRVRTVL